MISYSSITSTIKNKSTVPHIRHGTEVYECILKERREKSPHSTCSCLISLSTHVNRLCLVRELQVSISRTLDVSQNILHILQNVSPFFHPDEFASPALPGGELFRKYSLKQLLGKMQKGAQCYPLLKFLIDHPCFRTALTTCNITSGLVLPVSFLFL